MQCNWLIHENEDQFYRTFFWDIYKMFDFLSISFERIQET